MVIKREVAYGIVQGLSEFRNCEELQDFTVTVGETNFGCHKLLLAACSEFFRRLFRSGMKETKLNSVTIQDISSETFELILETIYTGRGILTTDNVIDIWRASHQLQVTFMVTECEMFVINSLSLENYIQYYQCGKLLSSENVTEIIWNFILQNCDFFFRTSFFLGLAFNDVLSLLKNQDLAASTEDEVLKAIVKWVEYNPKHKKDENLLQDKNENEKNRSPDVRRIKGSVANMDASSGESSNAMCLNNNKLYNTHFSSGDTSLPVDESWAIRRTHTESVNRKQHLLELLSNARTCLASHECLEMLLSHPLVSKTNNVKEIIIRAILYQKQINKRNGQWPTGATHRNISKYENVAITVNNDSKVRVYSFSKLGWSKYKTKPPVLKHEMIIQMVTVDKSLYRLCVVNSHANDDDYYYKSPFIVYILTNSKEESPIYVSLELMNAPFSTVSVNESIYIVQMDKFWKLKPSLSIMEPLCDLPVDKHICHLTCFDKTILAFYSVSKGMGVYETAVLTFDISKNTWTQLNNIDGPAYGLTSFKDDHTSYLLQPNGDLWRLVKPHPNVVSFELITKLWRCNWPLHGAVIFLDELFIYGTKSERINADPLRLKSVSGLFKKINYLQSLETCCQKAMFVPFIVDKEHLVSI